MYNQSYEDYMRSVLGYQGNYGDNTYQANMYNTYDVMQESNYRNEQEVENMYPEIYRIVYPMVCKACDNVSGPITEEVVETMTNNIFMSVETQESVKVNVKVENRNGDVKNPNARQEKELQETRQNNFLLRDLIRILLLRELLRRNQGGRPPMRPPFGGGPGMPGPRPPMRPPIRPRDFEGYVY